MIFKLCLTHSRYFLLTFLLPKNCTSCYRLPDLLVTYDQNEFIKAKHNPWVKFNFVDTYLKQRLL